MDPRAVFLDVDGTLINDLGHVPPSAAAAIRAARAKGDLVFLATGRSLADLWPEILAVGFDGYVLGSGAYVQVGDTVLARRHLTPEVVRHADDYLTAHGVPHYFQSNEGVYASVAGRDALRALLGGERDVAEVEDLEHGLLRFVDDIVVDRDPLTVPVEKVIYVESPLSIDEVRAEFADLDVVPSSVAVFGPSAGEMTARGIHKGAGIDLVIDHLGLDRAKTLAIGDSYNDLEMLAHVGVGIAMGNAPAEVKAAAVEVTTSPDEDGIRLAFERHGLA